MKRIAGIVLLLFLMFTTVYAAGQNEPYSATVNMDNIIIGGTLDVWEDTDVSLVVVKANRNLSELNGTNAKDIIAYQNQTTVGEDGSYTFEFVVKGDPGTYTYYIDADGYDFGYQDTFAYFGSDYLKSVLNNIDTAKLSNNGTQIQSLVESNYNKFGAAAPIYDEFVADGVNVSDLYVAVSKMENVNESIETLMEQLDAAAVLVKIKYAENGSAIHSIISNQNENYKKVFQFDNYTPYTTYMDDTILTQEQRDAICEKYRDKDYKYITEFKKQFQTDVILMAANTSASYGELKRVLINNSGIINYTYFSDYLTLGNKQDNVLLSLFGTNFVSIDDIRSKFDAAVLTVKNTSSGAGGSGGGGGSSGGGFGSGSKGATIVGDLITNSQEKSSDNNFNDLSDFSWAEDAINTLYAKKIINGVGEGKFEPQRNVSREEFTKMIVVAFDYYDENYKADFADVDISSWAYLYIASAVKNDIINGRGENYFGLGDAVTREDMAVIAFRTLKKYGYVFDDNKTDPIFSDSQKISGYAKEAVSALAREGIINGMGNNEFMPKQNSNRAQAAVIIYRILNIINSL